jgi:cell wall-associated NlpC family hydrolase
MRRISSLLVAVAISCVAVAAAFAEPPVASPDGTAPAPFWAASEVETVVSAGLMGPSSDFVSFRAGDPLTWGDLATALSAWGHPIAAPANPNKRVTVRELDARLVAALDLLPVSRVLRVAARDAGLNPIPSLGTEAVARLLGLRINHPAKDDAMELLPSQAVTRGEAAYSLARALAVTDWQKQQLLDRTAGFVLETINPWQKLVLTRALRFVGYPYIWTGTSEKAHQSLWDGTVVPGGFDCSGFVWRVYKLQPFPGAPELAETLRGRTTYAMSGEVDASLRIPINALQPGDVLFFGSRGPKSKPSEIGHMGVYVGSGWFVHSSEHGVTLQPMSGWYQTKFAWGRRPLAEAGLEATTSDEPVDPVAEPASVAY